MSKPLLTVSATILTLALAACGPMEEMEDEVVEQASAASSSKILDAFMLEDNVLTGIVCSNASASSLYVRVRRGGDSKKIAPALTQVGSTFEEQARYVDRTCGGSYARAYYFSARIPRRLLPATSFSLSDVRGFSPVALDADRKKVGILYHTFHCPVSSAAGSHKVFDINRILAGYGDWGPLNWHHWVGKPFNGYYCLKNNATLIRKHAVLLKNAGVDYIYIDITNWPRAYESDGRTKRADFREKIHLPLMSVVETYKALEAEGIAVPKIVPWIGTTTVFRNQPVPYSISVARWANEELYPRAKRSGLLFRDRFAKPLLFVKVGNKPGFAWSLVKPAADRVKGLFSVVPKWGHVKLSMANEPSSWTGLSEGQIWSFLERCTTDSSGKIVDGCHQRQTAKQVSVAAAYQLGYMLNPQSKSKRKGRTLYQQFLAAFSPGIRYVSVTGWNEWIARRLCFGPKPHGTAGYTDFDDISQYVNIHCNVAPGNAEFKSFGGKLHPMFVDAYTYERSRTLEPNRRHSDCYSQLLRALVIAAKRGRTGLDYATKLRFQQHCGFDLRK